MALFLLNEAVRLGAKTDATSDGRFKSVVIDTSFKFLHYGSDKLSVLNKTMYFPPLENSYAELVRTIVMHFLLFKLIEI